ncbi:hypothetical protein K443DRAFT_672882 [Laccaria amethystina LaAM-08-1]|uniref:Uncharacterized protein n=1 Tax=Laccaria amethystina LaAM-08-1 TaxID=1095629 RepID=A0A0C9YCH8_9AGAR|nr:hypothetical protein K443DRAFT_672882 [Laccaria amethystina LaAM-08-1]
MAVLEGNESDLMQLWGLITQLGEQLSQNQIKSVSLYSLTGKMKAQATNVKTGFVLRRFNTDKTKEEYETELERMNATMMTENQGLQHDNKQLNALIKDFEQTLETLMSNFRNRARDVQERELSLIREYESKLIAREEEHSKAELLSNTAISASIAHLSHLLRQLLRSVGGEDVESPNTRVDDDEDREPWSAVTAADYALERDIELARLEKENEELKRMMGLMPPQPRRASADPIRSSSALEVRPIVEAVRAPGVPKPSGVLNSNLGPFGTYKRMRSPG